MEILEIPTSGGFSETPNHLNKRRFDLIQTLNAAPGRLLFPKGSTLNQKVCIKALKEINERNSINLVSRFKTESHSMVFSVALFSDCLTGIV